jgi:DMSO/TMAO reductase YedYZ molybdopterin-dependent catalytic subunit
MTSSWNSVGEYVTYPQKASLILLSGRPVQLETPRHYFLSPFTQNTNFYVRWHLDRLPTSVNLSEWRLNLEGNVEKPMRLSMSELFSRFKPASVAAVNQCSGNSRSRFQPSVSGGQWGNGAMGNAIWTGVMLKELLDVAGVRKSSMMVQFEGMDYSNDVEGFGSNKYLKSLGLDNPILDKCLIAFRMNDEPLPMLNGFPARLVVPGYFATYWVKALTSIRVLDKPDETFWMKSAYRIPNTPRGNTTLQDIKAGTVEFLPIDRMPVRSFIISPDGNSEILWGRQVKLRGIALSGYDRVVKVEVSADDGKMWSEAQLGENYGAYSFRTWEFTWTPARPGRYVLSVRATDGKGNVQPDDGVWNPGGYLWNKIENQEVVVGTTI